MGILDHEFDMTQPEQPAPQPTAAPKRKRNYIWITVVVVLVLIASFLGGYFVAVSSGIQSDMPMLVQAYRLLKQYYIEDISWEEFQVYATAAMLGQVDPFTGLYTLKPRASRGIRMEQSVAQVNPLRYEICVASVTPGSPAAQAKAKRRFYADGSVQDMASQNVPLQRGDVIGYVAPYAVESPQPFLESDSTLYDMTNAQISYLQECISSAQEYLTLYIRRTVDGKSVLDEYVIASAMTTSVAAQYYSPSEIGQTDTALITFDEFSEQGLADYLRCLQEMVNDPEKPTHLILDLRANGGGSTLVCSAVAYTLLRGAPTQHLGVLRMELNTGNGKFAEQMLYAESSITMEEQTFSNLPNMHQLIPNFSVAILCGGSTASASEALIGALSCYDNVPYIGTRTYGKGVAQRTFRLGDYDLYITNGYYYVPTYQAGGSVVFEKNIHQVGFTPQGDCYVEEKRVLPYDQDACVKRAAEILAQNA